jgi:hypothetical protein
MVVMPSVTRMSVWPSAGARDRLAGDQRVAAGTIFDHDGNLQVLAELLGNLAGEHVGLAARRIADHDRHGPRGKGLRRRGVTDKGVTGEGACGHQDRQRSAPDHRAASLFLVVRPKYSHDRSARN